MSDVPPAHSAMDESIGEDMKMSDLIEQDLITSPADAEPEQETFTGKRKATPKKRAPRTKKSDKNEAAIADEPDSPKAVPRKASTKKTPAKKSSAESGEDAAISVKQKKTPAKKNVAAIEDSENAVDHNAVVTQPEDGSTPTPPKKTPAKKASAKATPKPKVNAEGVDKECVEETALQTPATKSAVKKRKAGEATPGTPGTKRKKPITVGGSYEELTPQDKLIVDMKNEGKKWQDIEPAWEKLMGVKPGKDTLRKRWPALEAASVKFSETDIRTMLLVKTDIEKGIWGHVAAKLKAEHNIDLGAKVLETKFEWLLKNGKIDASGGYIAPVTAAADAPQATSNASEAEANGDMEVEQNGAAEDGEMLV